MLLFRRVVEWVAWSRRRAAAAAAVVVLVVAMIGAAVVATAAGKVAGVVAAGACRDTAAGFTRALFDEPRDGAWPGRVARWVTPAARAGLTGLDPAVIPPGPARVTGVVEDDGRCEATVTVPGGALTVIAVRPDGQRWLVDAWGPQ